MDFSVNQALENVRVIDVERNYWFVRSFSGKLFNEYYERGYVALGFNDIPYQYIKEASKTDEVTYSRLRNYVKSKYDFKDGTLTGWVNQLISFEHGLKPGDMIIMPDENSFRYAFGIVESPTYLAKEDRTFEFKGHFELIPEKRKKVKWLKLLSKEDLNGDLKGLSSNHAAISAANHFSEVIEGHLSSLYIKEDRIYFTIKIDQNEDINAFAFNDFLSGLTYFYKEYCRENDIEDNELLYLKIKMQSRGKMALQGLSVAAIIYIATLFTLSDNPEIEAAAGQYHIKMKGEGLLHSLSKNKNIDADKELERKMKYEKFQDSIARLKAKTINDPIKVEDEKKIKKDIKHLHQRIQNITEINNVTQVIQETIKEENEVKDSTSRNN